ncbi:MAG: ATPase [Desulfitobacteriaceae bacterium]|nr:ATPase [Desulfitobacteriaceae bacterium]MDI6914287.1 ATPase [Desulfitobacteriaceae bacterium]
MDLEKDVLALLDELEEIVDRGTKIPMTGKVLVDDTVIFEILDKIRAGLPEEIQDAKWVLNERQRILNEAQAEAQKIVERGKTYAEKMAEENEVAKQAQAYAEDIVRQAQGFAREVKAGAAQYADELFQHVDTRLQETLQSLRRNRDELKSVAKESKEKPAEKKGE